jgi:hypothetical protein
MPLGRSLQSLLAVVLVGAPLAAALLGSPGPVRASLKLGPGDSAYLVGFTPEYEIDGGASAHWTTKDAQVVLPLSIEGTDVELAYRFARVLPKTAHVEVFLGGALVDRFSSRGGKLEERNVRVFVPRATPVQVAFKVDSRDPRDLGLRLHWLRVSVGVGGRIALEGFSRLAPAASVALLLLILAFSGWGTRGAVVLAAPASLALTLGLLRDPWLIHRLLTWIPGTLAILGLLGVGLGRLLVSRERLGFQELRTVTACAAAAFLLRALALNHPGFYYPDYMVHSRLVGVVRGAGVDFLRSPETYLWQPREGPTGDAKLVRAESGLWLREVDGVPVGMPYSLAFHAPFALLPLSYDQVLTAIKIAAVAFSTLSLVLTFALARRLGLALWGAALMVLAPSYLSKLAVGALPAVFGHAVDLVLLLWLGKHAEDLGRQRTLLAGACLVAASQLAYVSATIHMSLLIFLLALVLAWEVRQLGGPLRLLGMALLGSFLSLFLYYWHFLKAVALLASGLLHRPPGIPSPYAHESWTSLVVGRTYAFFGATLPLLALCGLVLVLRRKERRALVVAWALSYILLLLLRARLPEVFRWVHDTLFVTPLLCLLGGEVLKELVSRGSRARLLAGALLLLVAFEGLALQWEALVAHIANVL